MNGAPNGTSSGLQVTQFLGFAYDSISNIILGGAQDTGTPQQTAAKSQVYKEAATQGDGAYTAVDDLTSATQSARYIGNADAPYNGKNVVAGASFTTPPTPRSAETWALIPAGGVGGFTNFNVLAVSTVAPPAGQATRVVIVNGGKLRARAGNLPFDERRQRRHHGSHRL